MSVIHLTPNDAYTIMGALYERRETLLPETHANLMPEMFENFRKSELETIDELLRRMSDGMISLSGNVKLDII